MNPLSIMVSEGALGKDILSYYLVAECKSVSTSRDLPHLMTKLLALLYRFFSCSLGTRVCSAEEMMKLTLSLKVEQALI